MHETERITLARLPSGVELETTVHTYGDGGGPTLYVQAAQHGREINGSEVLRRLHGELLAREEEFSGTLVAVPVADPITFDRVSYTAPEALDSVNANMNRCWPADAEWADRGFGGKLRVAATQAGIPTITPELAHNTELVEDAIDAGVAGMLDTLRHLDMLPGEAAPTNATVARNHLGRVKADDSGLFHVDGDVELGDYVEPGDHVGVVYDPTSYDVLQEVAVDREGIVSSLEREATVTAGSTLVGVALRLEE